MSARRSPVGDVLVEALGDDPESAVAAARRLGHRVDELPEAAWRHGVGAFVHRALGASDVVPEPVGAALRDEYLRIALARRQALRDLAAATVALDGAGIDVVVLKGPSLAEVLYPDPELRGYDDLDLLVRAADLPAAVEALERGGHRLLDANWDLLLARRPGEIHLRAPSGTVVDLHWELLNDRRMRERMPIDVDAVVSRSEWTTIDDRPVRVLDPVDRLVFVALHACRSGGDRLIWLQDVRLCARDPRLDATGVVARADEWRMGTAFAVTLGRVRRVLGDGDAGVRPRTDAYERFDRLVTWVQPVQGSAGRRSAARLTARAAVDRPSTSTVALARNAWSWLRGGAPTGARPELDRDPSSERSPLRPSGGNEGRKRFFDAVSAGAG